MSERDLNIGGDSTGSVNITGNDNIVYSFIINNSSGTVSKIKTALLSAYTKPWEIEGVTLHNLPYSRNPFFTGRESVLEELHDSLTGKGDTALSQPALAGLGGVGKTQIALEYVYRHIAEYKAVFWVKAESDTTLTSDYLQIARLLDHPAKDHEDSRVVVGAVRRWLQAHQDWLLVYDNGDEPAILSAYLPTAHKGRILLTSRKTAFGDLAKAIEINKMDPGEAVSFLLKRCKLGGPSTRDKETASDICSEMGYLPLALDQAGAFIEKTHCSLEDYLKMFREAGLELLNDKDYSSGSYENTVATTWLLSIEKVRNECPGAEDILKLSAFLAPDDIPIDLFVKGAECFDDPLKSIVATPLDLNRALGTLLAYSLISRQQGAEQFSMHRLVQAVIRDRLDPSERRVWVDIAIASANAFLPDVQDCHNWPVCSSIIPHALSTLDHADSLEVLTKPCAKLLTSTGYYLDEFSDYSKAEALYNRALEIRMELHGEKHEDTIESLRNLGDVYASEGRIEAAESHCKRAVRLAEEVFGRDAPGTGACLNSLAIVCQIRGDYKQAGLHQTRALEIATSALGKNHSDTATGMCNLASVLEEDGKLDQAETLIRKSLKIRLQTLGPNHVDTSNSLHNLGGLLISKGEYRQAERLLLDALRIREKTYGHIHQHTVNTLGQIGKLYQRQGKYTRSKSFYCRALEANEQMLGRCHADVAYCLYSIGSLCLSQGETKQAEHHYRQALEINEEVLGSRHRYLATNLNCLGALLSSKGDYREAESLLRRALDIREEVLGPKHHEVAITLINLGATLYKVGRQDEGIEMLQRSYRILQPDGGQDSPQSKIVRQYLESWGVDVE